MHFTVPAIACIAQAALVLAAALPQGSQHGTQVVTYTHISYDSTSTSYETRTYTEGEHRTLNLSPGVADSDPARWYPATTVTYAHAIPTGNAVTTVETTTYTW